MFSIAAIFKAKVITGIVNKIYGLLDDGKGKEFIASIVNFLETKVKGSASEVDDALVLPLIKICRDSFELPKEARPIEAIVDSLKEILNKQLFIELADSILDFGEDFVLGTKSELDDKIFLPLFNHIRELLNIPDDDEE